MAETGESTMRLVQLVDRQGKRRVAVPNSTGEILHLLRGVQNVYNLALTAIEAKQSLSEVVTAQMGDEIEDYAQALNEQRVLVPIDHPDAAHCMVSITGLTHLGSAQARNEMHSQLQAVELSDSMKMFKLGLEAGKPPKGEIGVQPEWVYKGDGRCLVQPEQPICSPDYALDGGEEAELVGLYVIGNDGQPYRVGMCLGNEFSDHVMEKQNYLYLSHSKMRPCSLGPEMVIGEVPDDIQGSVTLTRDGKILWSAVFLTGEANMCHSIANLEQHHFKYADFCRPGDVHIHFYGASVLSFSEKITLISGDVINIQADGFGRSLRNPVLVKQATKLPTVQVL
jgi:hypothetical protein